MKKIITITIILLFIGVSVSSAISIDTKSTNIKDYEGKETGVEFEHINIPSPAICCEPGIMHWTKVKSEDTVHGTFKVWNCGDNGSILTWFVHSGPYWMNDVIFTPSNGKLTEGSSGQEVKFDFKAPYIPNWEFEGYIIVANQDEPQDFCEMPTTLKTLRNKKVFYNYFESLLNQFQILKRLLDLLR